MPVAVAVAIAFAFTRLLPTPEAAWSRVAWLAGVTVACSAVAWPVQRLFRRLLPLAALLELSIRFPGPAPNRWAVAREAMSISHLKMLAGGPPDSSPARAAGTILALVASLGRHDRITRGHSDRVKIFTDMIASEMGLPLEDRDRLCWAALVHDIGKLEVPGRLLRKPRALTASEWTDLRMHPEFGARLTEPLAKWLGPYSHVAIEHHERFDGTGYPRGLKGDEISLGARIVGLADALEVMTAARPYKRAISRSAALREIVRCSGTHFDPVVVRALLAVSTPKLRRALGPVSWIGQLPVVATAPVGGLPSVAGQVARSTGGAMLGGVAAGAVVVSSSVTSMASETPPVPSSGAPPSVASVVAPTPQVQTQRDPSTSGAPATAADAPGGVPTGPTPTTVGSVGATPADSPQVSVDGETVITEPPVEPPAVAQAGSTDVLATVNPPASGTRSGSASGPLGGVTGAVGGAVSGVTGTLGGAVGGVTGGVGDAVGGPVGDAVGEVGAATGDALSDLGDAAGDAVGTVGDVMDGALSGVLGGLLGGNGGTRK